MRKFSPLTPFSNLNSWYLKFAPHSDLLSPGWYGRSSCNFFVTSTLQPTRSILSLCYRAALKWAPLLGLRLRYNLQGPFSLCVTGQPSSEHLSSDSVYATTYKVHSLSVLPGSPQVSTSPRTPSTLQPTRSILSLCYRAALKWAPLLADSVYATTYKVHSLSVLPGSPQVSTSPRTPSTLQPTRSILSLCYRAALKWAPLLGLRLRYNLQGPFSLCVTGQPSSEHLSSRTPWSPTCVSRHGNRKVCWSSRQEHWLRGDWLGESASTSRKLWRSFQLRWSWREGEIKWGGGGGGGYREFPSTAHFSSGDLGERGRLIGGGGGGGGYREFPSTAHFSSSDLGERGRLIWGGGGGGGGYREFPSTAHFSSSDLGERGEINWGGGGRRV